MVGDGVGGGFCQNELILEFPTKSMPSDFCAQDRGSLVAELSESEIPVRSLNNNCFILCHRRLGRATQQPLHHMRPREKDNRTTTSSKEAGGGRPEVIEVAAASCTFLRLYRKRQRNARMAIGKSPEPIGSRHQARHAAPRQHFVLAKHRDRQAGIDERTEDR